MNMAVDRESAAALSTLQCTSPVCKSPDIDLTDSVDISSLNLEGDVWRAQGTVYIGYCVHGRCRTCGRLFEAARKSIPIQFPELTCPQCDKSEFLQYKIEGLSRVDDGFEFVATVRCSGCRAVATMKKFFTGLLNAISIEIGLTGITLKRSAATKAAD